MNSYAYIYIYIYSSTLTHFVSAYLRVVMYVCIYVKSHTHTYIYIHTYAYTQQADTLKGETGFTLVGIRPGDYAGTSVATVDVNGDGINDILVGAPGVRGNRGDGYIVFGNSGFGRKDTVALNLGDLDGVYVFVCAICVCICVLCRCKMCM